MGRGDMSDAEWMLIGPLLPSKRERCPRPADDKLRGVGDRAGAGRHYCGGESPDRDQRANLLSLGEESGV
jgi:hypothetical protein